MKPRLSPEESALLQAEIKNIKISNPEIRQIDCFKLALNNLNLTGKIGIHSSNASIWYHKVFPKQINGHENQPGEKSPEQIISDCEKVIQEQVRLLHQRRDIKTQEISHLDNLISKYKAPRS